MSLYNHQNRLNMRNLKYCIFILFWGCMILNCEAQEEYKYVKYSTEFEIDSIIRKSDFEYIYSPTNIKGKKILSYIMFKCAYKGYMYDCEIELDAKFNVKKIKLFARIVYTQDISNSNHWTGSFGIGGSSTIHHKKGDYAGTERFHSFKRNYYKQERTYYKDYLKQF